MKLIIEDDEGRRTIVPFVGEAVTIGRLDGSHVQLTEKNVSRAHGRLVRKDGRFILEDLKSFTGIKVNGEKVKGKRQIKAGDLIQISEYDIVLQLGPDDDPGSGGEHEHEPDPTAITTDPGSRQAGPPPPPDGAFGNDDEPTVTPAKPRADGNEAPVAPGPAASAGGSGLAPGEVPPQPAPGEFSQQAAGAPALPEAPAAQRPAVSASAGSAFGASLSASSEGGGKGKLIAIGLAAVALVAAVVIFTGRDSGEAADAGEAAHGPAHGQGPAQVALQQAERSASAHRFRDALKHLKDAQAAGANATDLKDLARTGQEAAAEEQFEQAENALRTGELDRARTLIAAAAPSTWWGAKAQALAAPGTAAAAPTAGADPGAAALAPAAAPAAATALAAAAPAAAAPAAAAASAPTSTAPPDVAAAAVAAAVPVAAAAPAAAPADPDAEARRLLQQGNLKVTSKEVTAGVADLEKAIALQPSAPVRGSIYRSLAQAWQRQGDKERTLSYYKLYLPYCDNPTEKAFLQQTLADAEAARKP